MLRPLLPTDCRVSQPLRVPYGLAVWFASHHTPDQNDQSQGQSGKSPTRHRLTACELPAEGAQAKVWLLLLYSRPEAFLVKAPSVRTYLQTLSNLKHNF